MEISMVKLTTFGEYDHLYYDFKDYVIQNSGPYDIEWFVTYKTRFDYSIKRRLMLIFAQEFCPHKLYYVEKDRVNISDIDDNTDYIFWDQRPMAMFGQTPSSTLWISNKNVATLLIISGYKFNECSNPL
jgi:hypothetical protein